MMKYSGLLLKRNSLTLEDYTIMDGDNVIGSLSYDGTVLECKFEGKIIYSEEVNSFKCDEERDRYYTLATWQIKKELVRRKNIGRHSISPDLNYKSIRRNDLHHILTNLCEDLEIKYPYDSEFRIHIADWLTSKGYTIVYS